MPNTKFVEFDLKKFKTAVSCDTTLLRFLNSGQDIQNLLYAWIKLDGEGRVDNRSSIK